MKLTVKFALFLALAVIAVQSTSAQTLVSPLPTVDFKDTFPWKIWVSSEGHDATYPAGFHYKLLSVRSADSTTVDFALIRELPNGSKIVALHARGALSKFDESATHVVDTLSKSLNITFQLFDLSDVHTAEEFRARASGLGWGVYDAPK